MRLSLLAICLVTSLVTGCTQSSDAAISVGKGTAFDPLTFFDGHTHSWGVVENRSGAPTGSVATNCVGEKLGPGRLRMVQHLSFANGTTQERRWTMWRTAPGRFDATANDMVGTAKGEVDGRVFHWQWILARSPGDPLMNVTVKQWMYQMPDGSVTIRTTISKLGFIAAEVTEQFTHGMSG